MNNTCKCGAIGSDDDSESECHECRDEREERESRDAADAAARAQAIDRFLGRAAC